MFGKCNLKLLLPHGGDANEFEHCGRNEGSYISF